MNISCQECKTIIDVEYVVEVYGKNFKDEEVLCMDCDAILYGDVE